MDTAGPPGRLRIFVIIAILCSLSVPAMGQAASAEKGRYTLVPMSSGFVRLDTLTGVVSHCEDKGSGWACYALPEEHAALDQEIGRLQTENEKLKAQLAARESGGQFGSAAPKSDGSKSADANRNSIEVPLPSDRDIGRLMSLVERTWRRLIEMTGRVEHDPQGRL